MGVVKPDASCLKGMVNPFSVDMSIEVYTSTVPGLYNNVGGDFLLHSFDRDRSRVSKLYLTSDNRLWIMGLSGIALRMFVWIVYELREGEDYVWINRTRMSKELGFSSRNTYGKGIMELVRYDVLCRTRVRDTYWINPRLMYNGNRLKKYLKGKKK